MKTLIGMPCGESIKSRTAFSLYYLEADELRMQRGCDVAENRNKLARHALDNGFTHILFVDSDMQFPPDTLKRLLTLDKDIVGIVAHHKKLPLESNVKPLTEEEAGKPFPTEPFQCGAIGTGIMLVKTTVFSELPEPWFYFSYKDGQRQGEDFNFCTNAREHGFEVWADPTIPIKHVGEYLY